MNDQSFWVHAAISHTAYLTLRSWTKFCCSASTMQRRNRSSRLSFCAVAARCSNSFLAASVMDQLQKMGEKSLILAQVSNQKAEIYIYSTSFFQSSQKEEKKKNIGPAHIIETQNEHTNHWKLATSRSRSCRKSISACSSSCPFTPHLHEKLENRCSSSKPIWCVKNRSLQPQSPALQLQNPQPPHLRAAPMASANWEASPRFKALRRAETCGKSQRRVGSGLENMEGLAELSLSAHNPFISWYFSKWKIGTDKP